MQSVDLNCDVGEGCGNDAELMKLITSANIACGYHAGDAETMRRTVDLAFENGVKIGAHPGYKDLENFGRTPMSISATEVYKIVTDQMSILNEIAVEKGTSLTHVKPHGALYNQAAGDAELAAAISEAVFDFGPDLVLYGLSGSMSISEAQKRGLRTASEVFADRTYQTNGTLTPRSEPNALIDNVDQAAEQALNMIKYGRVRSVDAIMIFVAADTICIHGDGQNAVAFARTINERLKKNAIAVSSP